MERIWEALIKPPELKDRKLSDYFDLAFTALPHKVLVPEKFEQEVAKLRNRFVDKNSPDYLFKPLYHKRIPADGVAFYMENIWVCILAHRYFLYIFLLLTAYIGASSNQQGP